MAANGQIKTANGLAYGLGSGFLWGVGAELAFGAAALLGFVATGPLFVGVTVAAMAFGFFRGVGKAHQINQQAAQLKMERDGAAADATAMAQAMTPAPDIGARRFTDTIQSRGARGSYADAVQADRAVASETGRA